MWMIKLGTHSLIGKQVQDTQPASWWIQADDLSALDYNNTNNC